MTTESTLAKHLALLLTTALAVLVMAGCAAEEAPAYQPSAGGEAGVPVAVAVPDLSEKARAGETVFNATARLARGLTQGNRAGSAAGAQESTSGPPQDFSVPQRGAERKGIPIGSFRQTWRPCRVSRMRCREIIC